jgi:hypothetical protein
VAFDKSWFDLSCYGTCLGIIVTEASLPEQQYPEKNPELRIGFDAKQKEIELLEAKLDNRKP